MLKKSLICISILLCCICLCSCWDYTGVNQLAIVAGIAIDEPEDGSNGLCVSFEVLNIANSGGQTISKPVLIEAQGKTFTEAVYFANNKIRNNLYFGNVELVIVSKSIAEKQGLNMLIDPLLRDAGIRNNLFIIVSKEETAKELIKPEKDAKTIISYNLNSDIGLNSESIKSTMSWPLYQIYNTISLELTDLTLPLVGFSKKTENKLELDGLAVFSKDKMIGNLTDNESMYYLLISSSSRNDKIKIVHRHKIDPGSEETLTLTNKSSHSGYDFSFDGEKFTFTVDIKIHAAAVEFSPNNRQITMDSINEMELIAEQDLNAEITQLVSDIQQRYGVDIFGFGHHIRMHDNKLWNEVKGNWNDWFKTAEVIVNCKVTIEDTGLIREY